MKVLENDTKKVGRPKKGMKKVKDVTNPGTIRKYHQIYHLKEILHVPIHEIIQAIPDTSEFTIRNAIGFVNKTYSIFDNPNIRKAQEYVLNNKLMEFESIWVRLKNDVDKCLTEREKYMESYKLNEGKKIDKNGKEIEMQLGKHLSTIQNVLISMEKVHTMITDTLDKKYMILGLNEKKGMDVVPTVNITINKTYDNAQQRTIIEPIESSS